MEANTERSEGVPSNCRLNCRTFKNYSLTVLEIRIEIFFSFSLKLQRTQGKQILGFWEGVTRARRQLEIMSRFYYFKECSLSFRNLCPWIFKRKLQQQRPFSGRLTENRNLQPNYQKCHLNSVKAEVN